MDPLHLHTAAQPVAEVVIGDAFEDGPQLTAIGFNGRAEDRTQNVSAGLVDTV